MRTLPTLLLALACTLAACGDDGGGPGPVDSGLPADKAGKDLSAAEEETLCDARLDNLARQNTAAEQRRFQCLLDAMGFTQMSKNTPEECQQVFDMCEEPASGGDGGGGTCMFTFDLSTCEATVAEIEACLTEQNEAVGDGIRALSCDDVGKPPATPTVGPACTQIKTTCPGIA